MDPSGKVSAPKTQNGSVEGRQSRRRERTKYSPDQIDFLKRAFVAEPYPSYRQLLEMEATLDIPSGRLQVWFQNRRARHLNCKLGTLLEIPSLQNPLLQGHSRPSEEPGHSTDPASAWAQHQPSCQGTTWTLVSDEKPEGMQAGSWDGGLPLHPYSPCANYSHTPAEASCPGDQGGNGQKGGQSWTTQHGLLPDPEHKGFSWSFDQGACGSPCGPSSYMQEDWTSHSGYSAPTYNPTSNSIPSSPTPGWNPATLRIPSTQNTLGGREALMPPSRCPI